MKRKITSCFGLGYLPIAPGTWGSMPPAAIFVLLCYFGVGVFAESVVMIVLAVAGSIGCVTCAQAAIDATGKKDPGEVVIDEFAGQAVTFIGLAGLSGIDILIVGAVGFLLFRFFDILKPWPCRRLEKVRGGWGILLDDLCAGVYAGIVLQVCVRIWIGA